MTGGIIKPAIASLFLPLLLSACALAQVGAVMHPTVSGSLVVRQSDGSETLWTPDRCASGDRSYFLGFEFASSQDQSQLRTVREATTGIVVRWVSAQHVALVHAGDCAKLELDIEPTGWRVNEIREFAGHVQMQCTTADGLSIAGRINVDHCH